jgi:L-arabinose isomerase
MPITGKRRSIDMGKKIILAVGSQHLYGPAVLEQVRKNGQTIAAEITGSGTQTVPLEFGKVLTTSEEITAFCRQMNTDPDVIGLVLWMHTFSPAKMWISGLKEMKKPFAHLHTQFNREIPWDSIDMNYMNLHQSAHGDREFGFICSRLRIDRTVIAGYWKDAQVQKRLDVWGRAALAWADSRTGKVARFGDNMREVAVTEGDKVAAQETFGYAVHGYGIGDLVKCISGVPEDDTRKIVEECLDQYIVAGELLPGGARHSVLQESARIEAGLGSFLKTGGFTAFTTTFEDLHGLNQLPGLAVQRLMAKGYGFGAEGDWKTAALVRSVKIMARNGGTSFMEDYTYHLEQGNMMVLGAHMLEVCPSIAGQKPRLEVHPLSIGGKGDPVRLVFTARSGPAINVTIIDMGSRFRMIANTLETVNPARSLPKLPVASVLWKPDPDLETGSAAWILSGGAHHSAYSQGITVMELEDFASFAGMELIVIGKDTNLPSLKKELKWNDSAY